MDGMVAAAAGSRLAHHAAVMRAIHRRIECRAAANGQAIAIADEGRGVSYQELNAAANAMARRLMAAGFKRGMHAHVRMAPSGELAVVLLAILKAGGCYTWTGNPECRPEPSIQIGRSDSERRELPLGDVLPRGAAGGPNLPVITRETDIACLLERGAGESPVAVPHGTVMAMASLAAGERLPWAGEPGAFDLWVILMAGATAVVRQRQSAAA
jgi:hypothetical protein